MVSTLLLIGNSGAASRLISNLSGGGRYWSLVGDSASEPWTDHQLVFGPNYYYTACGSGGTPAVLIKSYMDSIPFKPLVPYSQILTGAPLVLQANPDMQALKHTISYDESLDQQYYVHNFSNPCDSTVEPPGVIFRVSASMYALCWVSEFDDSAIQYCSEIVGNAYVDVAHAQSKSMTVTCITQDNGTPSFDPLVTPSCHTIMPAYIPSAIHSKHIALPSATLAPFYDLLGRKLMKK